MLLCTYQVPGVIKSTALLGRTLCGPSGRDDGYHPVAGTSLPPPWHGTLWPQEPMSAHRQVTRVGVEFGCRRRWPARSRQGARLRRVPH